MMYDKYEPYIWSSYAVSVVGMVLLALWMLRTARKTKRELETLSNAPRRAKTEEQT